jgi:putative SOS response-associated peptidase YedK
MLVGRFSTNVTTTPSELFPPIHNRMPVILPPVSRPLRLGEDLPSPTT